MKQETDYLVKHGLAVPSSSPWCSPCLFVPKSDGSSCFCTDYRKFSQVTKADSYPLAWIEVDLLKGYWQVPLTERASEISDFATPDAFLQYKVLAFSLKNAPATFQSLMCKVLSNVNNCEDYLDEVVCYSKTWGSHLKTLEEVYTWFKEANLTLNLTKYKFLPCYCLIFRCNSASGVRPLEGVWISCGGAWYIHAAARIMPGIWVSSGLVVKLRTLVAQSGWNDRVPRKPCSTLSLPLRTLSSSVFPGSNATTPTLTRRRGSSVCVKNTPFVFSFLFFLCIDYHGLNAITMR